LNEIHPTPDEFDMSEILAHITQYDVPGYWLAGFAGFLAGVAVTYAMFARKTK
jgi:glycerol uptake facilitator-like aquaporin